MSNSRHPERAQVGARTGLTGTLAMDPIRPSAYADVVKVNTIPNDPFEGCCHPDPIWFVF